jgi:glycosyltransferase involved in cell wall biosynthesis
MTSTDKKKTKILFFAPILEYPPAGGPQLSVVNAVKVLSRISELHIVTTVPQERLRSAESIEFFRSHCHSLIYSPTSRWMSNHKLVDRLLRRSRRLLAPVLACFDVRCMIQHAKREGIEIFWVDRVLEHAYAVFRMLRRMRPEAAVVGDTEAVYSLFLMRELPMVKNPLRWLVIWLRGKKTQMEERSLVSKADAVTAVSDIDAEFFRRLGREPGKVMRFSNVVDLEDYRNIVPPLPKLRKPCALLLGSFGHVNSPMDRAARWVAEDIMPIVWRSVPEAHLYIIGRNSHITQAELNCERITVVGQVPSVLPYLKQAALTLVPLRFESGTRFKIVESGAAAVACVSTTLGAEGLDVRHGDNILIADETDSFAEAMISVFSSPELQHKLGSNLHELVRRNYSLEKQTKEGEMILRKIKEKLNE